MTKIKFAICRYCTRIINRKFPRDLAAFGLCENGRPCLVTGKQVIDFSSWMKMCKFMLNLALR